MQCMKVKLYVNEGRVNCPRRGDIDIDTCFCCQELVDVRRENDEEVIVCEPRFVSPLESPLFIRW